MSLNIGILSSAYKAAAPPSGNLLLDDYPGASNAYSLRKLRSAYSGNCVRIIRSSDNTQIDIGFVDNVIDTTAISTFCGAGNGFVTIWYDQSGNGNGASSILAGTGPQIYFSGSFVLRGGKIAIQLGRNLAWSVPFVRTASQNYSFWVTYEKNNAGNNYILSDQGYMWLDFGQTRQWVNNSQQINITPNNFTANTRYLVNNICDTSLVTMYANNTIYGSRVTTDTARARIIGEIITTQLTLQEIILYPNSQAANRTAINNNINTFYTIY